jgi:hypothetical protein
LPCPAAFDDVPFVCCGFIDWETGVTKLTELLAVRVAEFGDR